jgi:hypothetical protein
VFQQARPKIAAAGKQLVLEPSDSRLDRHAVRQRKTRHSRVGSLV